MTSKLEAELFFSIHRGHNGIDKEMLQGFAKKSSDSFHYVKFLLT